MTLIMAVHNQKHIAVANDSMSVVSVSNGGKEISYGKQKIYPINTRTAILISGTFTTGFDELFFGQFSSNHRSISNVDEIFELLQNSACRHLSSLMDDGDIFEVILAGFSKDDKPTLHHFQIKRNGIKEVAFVSDRYKFSGYKEPKEHLHNLLVTRKLDQKRLFLKREAASIMKECIDRFPKLLGGDAKVIILKP